MVSRGISFLPMESETYQMIGRELGRYIKLTKSIYWRTLLWHYVALAADVLSTMV